MKFLRKVEETKSEESFVSFCSPLLPPDDLLQILLTLASSFIMFGKNDFKVFTKVLGTGLMTFSKYLLHVLTQNTFSKYLLKILLTLASSFIMFGKK